MLVTLIYFGLMLLLLLFLGGLGLLYYARDYAAPVPPAVPGTVKVASIGDSITFGALVKDRKINCYPAQLEKLLGIRYSVRNFGVNGHSAQKFADKPYWTHKHFMASLSFDPDIVLIMLGTNDAAEQNWIGTDAFITDYKELLQHYADLPSHPVIHIMTPPTQFTVKNYTKVVQTMNNNRLDLIADALKKLGRELDVNVIDIHTATKTHPEFFTFDGLHPDAGGARFIAETVYEVLKPTAGNT